MSTVNELITQAVTLLDQAGVDSPRLNAELLLAHVLGKARRWLWTYPELTPSEEQIDLFETLLERRVHREPLAYLLGEWDFYGRAFMVTPDVLIPRPETELLVEGVITWANAHSAQSIVDVGTGSGAIAITLALELPQSHVTAIDISPGALEVARRNAETYHVIQRLQFVQGDLLQPIIEVGFPVDIIVANLPYIPTHEIPALMPEVRDYEPHSALEAEEGGLALIYRLIEQSPSVLHTGGLLALEVGMGQAETLAAYLSNREWQDVHIITDYAGILRHILATCPATHG